MIGFPLLVNRSPAERIMLLSARGGPPFCWLLHIVAGSYEMDAVESAENDQEFVTVGSYNTEHEPTAA